MSTYTGVSEAAAPYGVGPQVVRILRAYNKALPLAFLAHLLRRNETELSSEINRLEQNHVVKRVDNKVALNG